MSTAALTAPGPVRTTVTPLRLPTLALLLVAIGGSYSLDRAGLSALGWLDLRVLGLAVALPLVWLDTRRVRRAREPLRRREGWVVAAATFFLFQVASAAWAPPDARTAAYALDVSCMALLTLGFYVHARQDPLVVARRALWFLWATGLVFALGALALTGAGDQGRYAAFGGGPNVFVRIEILGVIAAAALVATGARRSLLWSVPLLAVSAVLSGSRGGLLAAVVVGLLTASAGGRRARRVVVLATVSVVGSVLLAYALSGAVSNVVQTRFVQQTTEQGYDSGRGLVWRDSAEMALRHPLAGTGLDGFHALVGATIGIEYPHNYLLAVAAEGGMLGLGLLALTAVLWARTVRWTRDVRGPPRRGVELMALMASAAYIAVASLFSGGYYDARLAWCCAALAAALVVYGREPRASEASG